MTTIEEATTQLAQTQQQVAASQQQAEDAQAKLQAERNALPNTSSEQALRQTFKGQSGMIQRQNIQNASNQINSQLNDIQNYEQQLSDYQTNTLQPYQQQITQAQSDYDAQVQANNQYANAYNVYIGQAKVNSLFQNTPQSILQKAYSDANSTLFQPYPMTIPNLTSAQVSQLTSMGINPLSEQGLNYLTSVSSAPPNFPQTLMQTPSILQSIAPKLPESTKVQLQSIPSTTGFSVVSTKDLNPTAQPSVTSNALFGSFLGTPIGSAVGGGTLVQTPTGQTIDVAVSPVQALTQAPKGVVIASPSFTPPALNLGSIQSLAPEAPSLNPVSVPNMFTANSPLSLVSSTGARSSINQQAENNFYSGQSNFNSGNLGGSNEFFNSTTGGIYNPYLNTTIGGAGGFISASSLGATGTIVPATPTQDSQLKNSFGNQLSDIWSNPDGTTFGSIAQTIGLLAPQVAKIQNDIRPFGSINLTPLAADITSRAINSPSNPFTRPDLSVGSLLFGQQVIRDDSGNVMLNSGQSSPAQGLYSLNAPSLFFTAGANTPAAIATSPEVIDLGAFGSGIKNNFKSLMANKKGEAYLASPVEEGAYEERYVVDAYGNVKKVKVNKFTNKIVPDITRDEALVGFKEADEARQADIIKKAFETDEEGNLRVYLDQKSLMSDIAKAKDFMKEAGLTSSQIDSVIEKVFPELNKPITIISSGGTAPEVLDLTGNAVNTQSAFTGTGMYEQSPSYNELIGTIPTNTLPVKSALSLDLTNQLSPINSVGQASQKGNYDLISGASQASSSGIGTQSQTNSFSQIGQAWVNGAKEISAPQIKSQTSQVPLLNLDLASGQASQFKQQLKSQTKQEQPQQNKNDLALGLASVLSLGNPQVSRTGLTHQTKQQTKQEEKVKQDKTKLKLPSLGSPLLKKQVGNRRKRFTGVVKKRGQLLSIGNFPSQRSAEIAEENFLKNTTSASAETLFNGKPIRPTSQAFNRDFRPSRTKNPFLIVEKKGGNEGGTGRLSTRGAINDILKSQKAGKSLFGKPKKSRKKRGK